GRVNRRGEGDARVIVLTEPPSKEVETAPSKPREKRKASETEAIADAERKNAVRQLFDRLPQKDGAVDASLGAIRTLKSSAESDDELLKLIEAATTPVPLRPALSRALVDAW